MRRKAGPVQQWVDSIGSTPFVDSIPLPERSPSDPSQIHLDEPPTPPLTPVSSKESIFNKPTMTVSSPIVVPDSPIITMSGVSSPLAHNRLARDPSFQSDSSHCSSVESLLELRRADPEAVLLGLGFGGCPNTAQENGPLSRIPKRFLQPSKLQGIAINDFVKHQQETSESLDSASLGYRGLTGSPYVAPSEIVQKIMERLREHESHEQDAYTVHNNNTEPYSPIYQDTGRLSVLSPDNRQFLERPRSKSPDMRNKRMIIGQKSFAFGCNGDLIEIDGSSRDESHNSSTEADGLAIELHETFSIRNIYHNPNDKPEINDQTEMSSISKLGNEKRLSKQLPIGEIVGDLILETSDVPSSIEINEELHDSAFQDEKTRTNEKGEFMTSPRRASYDSCDMRKTPMAELLQEDGRRYSDGFVRQSSSLFNRRKSLKRQSRISDSEASEYCELNPNLSVPEELEISISDSETERFGLENQYVAEGTKLKAHETDRRSDRLSTSDLGEELEQSTDLLLDVDIPTEKSNADEGTSNSAQNQDSSLNKRKKKKHGLSRILGMYNSGMSVKMEPGF